MEKHNPINPKTKRFSDLLIRVTNELVSSETLEHALLRLVEITSNTIGCERGTIFLNDETTGELYSKVAQGDLTREIRFINNKGIAGWSFTHDDSVIVNNAYQDERFNKKIDETTGFKTKNLLCVPLKNVHGKLIGVAQALNKFEGEFTETDIDILSSMTMQASIAVENKLHAQAMHEAHKKELEFLDIISDVSSEIKISSLLEKFISAITRLLDAERSTLFINDEKTNELFTEVGEGLGKTPLRFPNHLGIAGTVFTTGKTINIPHAYSDLRFNPDVDRKTGFFTRSILCCPIRNKQGLIIGVTQVLNKKGGQFSAADESQLKAFTSQIAITIENAKLFEDVEQIKNYNESMLESMSNAVITINEDNEIITCNASGLRIFDIQLEHIIKKNVSDFFGKDNTWIIERLKKISSINNKNKYDIISDTEIKISGKTISANITLLPLLTPKGENMGSMIVLEDISGEKRMKSTMSRYMSPDLADKLMEGGESALGGAQSVGTVLFSDIRSFTTLTESLGAEGTVTLLNEYFTLMVDCIQAEEGMLDKFIGDAIMAIFGVPFQHDDDPDRAVRAGIQMMHALTKFNEARKKQGIQLIDHGLGINTDKIVSGNIGSPKRMDYTVIGDGVNLASRLESACKQYGAHLIISEYTFKSLKATYRTRPLDKVIVKGKTEPVSIYEVVDFFTEESFPHQVDVLGFFNDGVDLYHQQKWDKAIEQFKKALELNPNDKASQMYIERCEQLKQQPPGDDWNGVWVMTSK